MKKYTLWVFIIVLALLFNTSCTTIQIDTSIHDKVVALSPLPGSNYDILGSFSEEVRIFFTINGLLRLNEVETNYIVNNAVNRYKGDGVVNLRVKDQYNGIDILLNIGLSAGGYLLGTMLGGSDVYMATIAGSIGSSAAVFFLQSRTVTLSGDVFKFR
jgi:hypothetical protein